MIKPQPRFLYVEDDVKSRKVVELLITRVLGYPDFAVFENSSNVVERARTLAFVPGIVLLDVQIDPYDGFEVLHMLRNDVILRHATVIAMTANVMTHAVEELRRAGFNGLIGKPILSDTFPMLMNKVLAGEAVWYVP